MAVLVAAMLFRGGAQPLDAPQGVPMLDLCVARWRGAQDLGLIGLLLWLLVVPDFKRGHVRLF